MFHICRTIRRHFSLRQVKLCIGQRKNKQTDRPSEWIRARSLLLLFRILQNGRKKENERLCLSHMWCSYHVLDEAFIWSRRSAKMFTKDRRGQDERGTSSVPHIPPLFFSSRFRASVGLETKMLELCLSGISLLLKIWCWVHVSQIGGLCVPAIIAARLVVEFQSGPDHSCFLNELLVFFVLLQKTDGLVTQTTTKLTAN